MSNVPIGMVLMPQAPTEAMLDRVTDGVSEEWRSYRRERARQTYRDFVAAVQKEQPVLPPRHHSAQLVSIPSGEYVGKASGNRVVVDGEFKFVVQTEDYVKGIDCPCTVIVDAGSNRYWVVYR